MLLNHLRFVVRKLLNVGVGAVLCFTLEFGQILFMVFDHRIDVGLIRAPAYLWLLRRQRYVLLRCNLF